ncbi:MAG TPA: class I SAM-dependent methyltransferase [Pyrinomonadaceae bacterium]|nr:class I SAM-dependent methyltransferase [Pyrinomonadaceae bacterium]
MSDVPKQKDPERVKGAQLDQEMQQHFYPIMYEVEDAHWWYAGRRRIIASLLETICATLNTHTPAILDVGCGTGANLDMLQRFGEVEGVDISDAALAFCRQRGYTNVRRGAAQLLPYEDNTFDVITALDVVEHLDDDIGSLREMRRVLKPNGRALLFVPAFKFLWGVQDDVSNHRRRYTLSQLKAAASEAGFEIERASYANISFFVPILLVRTFMRVAHLRPPTELGINIPAFNGLLGSIFGAERFWLQRGTFPFGVSAFCVLRR